jgi:hypothetical protein
MAAVRFMQHVQHRLSVRVDEKKSKLISAIQAKCREINDSGDTALEAEVAQLQAEFANPTWKYDDFEQTFMEKYKKYPKLLGETPSLSQQCRQ